MRIPILLRWHLYVDGLVHERRNCIANTLELRLSCTNPSILTQHRCNKGTMLQQSWICTSLIARFMGPTWGPSGADRAQVGPMLAPWTLLSGIFRTECYDNMYNYNSLYMQIEMFCSWKSANNFCVDWECVSAEIIPILCTFSCSYTWLFESVIIGTFRVHTF